MQVADWLQTHLHPRGVGVVIEAEHLCMTVRGVRAGGTSTITSALVGGAARGFAVARRPSPSPCRRRPVAGGRHG
jgi:GTP cyclohydrolase I